MILLLQSFFQPLIQDEAYYWVFSQFPSWGYLDHPPMVAWWISVGTFLFYNEIGVRLVFVFSNLLVVYLAERIIKPKSNWFYLILFSIPFLNIGYLAIPDAPLLLFSTCFFPVYKDFIQKANWNNTVLLSITTALMLYSKYHGIAVIVLSVAAVPKLLLSKWFYFVLLFTTILFLPHLWWQYRHEWPSFEYHIHERTAVGFSFSNVVEFSIGTLL